MGRNSGPAPSWVWFFLCNASGELTASQHKASGTTALWDLGRTQPSAKVRAGQGEPVITAEAQGLKGRASPSCKPRLQGGNWELFLCVANGLGLKYD